MSIMNRHLPNFMQAMNNYRYNSMSNCNQDLYICFHLWSMVGADSARPASFVNPMNVMFPHDISRHMFGYQIGWVF